MAVQADEQCDKRCVDELEPQVALDDVIHPVFIGAGFPDDIFQYRLGHRTTQDAHASNPQQVDIGHPLPGVKPERLENGEGEHRENDADDAGGDGIFLFLAHRAAKLLQVVETAKPFVTNMHFITRC